jgi:predicted type IV restriction endonuclease
MGAWGMSEILREAIQQVIDKIQQAEESGRQLSEADTERLVIEPILAALGYDGLDYKQQAQGQAGDIPDYIVLPDTEQQWVLEAKEWNAQLTEKCEAQVVKYAATRDVQWAVLTNGRTWWIYNTRASGDMKEKRVYEVPDIRNVDQAAEVLSYLSRSSILGGELDRAYRVREISNAIEAELRAGNRKILNAIRTVVCQRLDRLISIEDVNAALEALLAGEREKPVSVKPIEGREPTPGGASEGWVKLSDLISDPSRCTGLKPRAIRLDSQPEEPVSTWRDVVMSVLQAPGVLDRLQIPFPVSAMSKRYFVNYEPVHASGNRMIAVREFEVGGHTVYVAFEYYAARELLQILGSLLRATGVEPDVWVLLEKGGGTAQD